MALTRTAHACVTQALQPIVQANAPCVALDATCGNGNDTLFLLQLGVTQVIGFDLQQEAIAQTKQRCQAFVPPRLILHQCGHEHLGQHIPNTIHCAMFNLGYLPHADSAIITQTETTLSAIQQAYEALAPGGIMSILCYRGHGGGPEETAAVSSQLDELSRPKNFTLTRYDANSATEQTPVLFILQHHELA